MKKLKPIKDIIEQLGIEDKDIVYYGEYMAKINYKLLDRLKDKKSGKLILVSAITPTSEGEGKTTVTIGLGMALSKLGKKTVICLREPSLGPVFGIKGGACGGGASTVEPMNNINLHFTGDMHAVTSAHNLLSACLDNHIYHGNELNIDTKNIFWKRALDMNERSLRSIKYNIRSEEINSGFEITAASEIMAILCLSNDLNDLKNRLGDIVVALDKEGNEIKAKQLNVVGAIVALMKDTINPNIVQTIENTPAFIHGGPFGNIAHGTNSIIAAKLALKLSDFVVTEAGFGADLGAEKFFDIVCRVGGFNPACVVLVATIKALKLHGGAKDLKKEDLTALGNGIANLEKQVENIKLMNMDVVIAINKFDSDSKREIKFLENICSLKQIPDTLKNHICYPTKTPIILVEVFQKGSEGGMDLAKRIIECKEVKKIKFQYDLNDPIKVKIETIAKNVFGAKDIIYSGKAQEKIKRFDNKNIELPICIAKTQASLSDDPRLLGRPQEYKFHITDIKVATGAGFIVVYAGNIVTMPGLPKKPSAEKIDVDENGEIIGLS